MLDISASSDFKRVGSYVPNGYYDVTLLNKPNEYECYGVYAMDQALENYLLTVPGERLFNVEFGSPLYAVLFKNNTNTEELKEQIYQNVENMLSIVIDRNDAEISTVPEDPHVFTIHFRYSTNDGVIINHEFTRRFSK